MYQEVHNEGSQLKEIEYIVNHSKIWGQSRLWIEETLSQYKNEKSALPTPQLSIESWIAGGICTNLLFCLAIRQRIKIFPKFYLSSIFND